MAQAQKAPAAHQSAKPRTQRLTIIAQDPGVRVKQGRKTCILRAQIEVPAEQLAPGPWGYRVQVVDYDASSNQLWKPMLYQYQNDVVVDPFEEKTDDELLSDPQFHQQNVYAIVMRILARFEYALGRRVSWSYGGHQLKIAPHAFLDANAFYTKEDEALLFGYFADPAAVRSGKTPQPGKGIVFSCLSHDVVAHETTHALVDGLRRRFTDPSSPDQAAFHEGISDVVALLSVFSLTEVVLTLLEGEEPNQKADYSPEGLRQTALFKLAEEMGSSLTQIRGSALRHSTDLPANDEWKTSDEFLEPHRRGEVLVAMMLNALIHIWSERIKPFVNSNEPIELRRIVEEGQRAADYLLTMSIRALDYCPPVHLEFGDYLSALLTADLEIRPDDSVFNFRKHLLASFGRYGIEPASKYQHREPGIWAEPEIETKHSLDYSRTHFEPMQRDTDEVFRFVWENREALGLCPDAYTEVQSVRPCVRVGEDGFMLHETVAEYVQILRAMPDELEAMGVELPPANLLPPEQEVFLHGGGTLIFDERGRLKYHVHNHLTEKSNKITKKQGERLRYLAETGYFLSRASRPASARASRQRPFGQMHLNRSLNRPARPLDGWLSGAVSSLAHRHAHGDSPGHHPEPTTNETSFESEDDSHGEN